MLIQHDKVCRILRKICTMFHVSQSSRLKRNWLSLKADPICLKKRLNEVMVKKFALGSRQRIKRGFSTCNGITQGTIHILRHHIFGIFGPPSPTLAGTDLLCMLNWGTQWTMVSYLKK